LSTISAAILVFFRAEFEADYVETLRKQLANEFLHSQKAGRKLKTQQPMMLNTKMAFAGGIAVSHGAFFVISVFIVAQDTPCNSQTLCTIDALVANKLWNRSVVGAYCVIRCNSEVQLHETRLAACLPKFKHCGADSFHFKIRLCGYRCRGARHGGLGDVVVRL